MTQYVYDEHAFLVVANGKRSYILATKNHNIRERRRLSNFTQQPPQNTLHKVIVQYVVDTQGDKFF